MTVEFPSKLRPLFSPSRWKSIRGGRDGGKSWGVSAALTEIGSTDEKVLKAMGLWCDGPEFIVCARENMNSIADSVHRLLENTIHRLQLESMWHIGKASMKNHRTGAEFVFKGVHHNPDAIKSLEGATRAWLEEAQSISDDSWRQIIPTIRRPNSEIWATWNPKLETDPTYQRLVTKPPPGIADIQMNYSDNPWASSVLKAEREQMQRDNPDEYAHVWLGQPRRSLEGAVYANELRLAEEQGRIGKVPYQPGCPVYTGWDLGDSDMTAIWFIQAIMGQYRVIDYLEDSHKPMSFYLTALEGKGYRYATDYFPWDASSRILIGSLEETMRQRGRTVKVNARMSREVGIDRVREMLGTCWFDEEKCVDGLQRLRYYRYGQTKMVDPATGDKAMTREPIHDDNSHGSDALRTFAMGYRSPKPEKPKPAVVVGRRYVPPPTAWS
jgi:phage terminase large subunit